MEIRVKGTGQANFVSDQIALRLTFNKIGADYATVLAEGAKITKSFIEGVLAQNGFSREDLKTSSFVVRENRIYNEATRNWEKDGFIFQQDATLEFDYDKDKLVKMMAEIAQLENAPTYRIAFSLKDKEAARRKVLAAAYEDAKAQAEAIAMAAGKQLKQCLKTDFQSNMPNFESNSEFGVAMRKSMNYEASSTAEDLAETFTPEDVMVLETLYCLWNAE